MNFKDKNILLFTFLILSLSSCGLLGKRSNEQSKKAAVSAQEQKKNEASKTPEPTTIAPAPARPTPQSAATPQEAKDEPASSRTEASAPAQEEKRHIEFKPPNVPAETSLKWLKNGNTRYVKKSFRGDGRTQSDRERLAKGQHPHAVILSCSDSRVPPEIVFDQALGEVFVIRVIGEALDSTVIASLEYAVEHLHIGLLVVMGHTQCGAVQATMKTPEGTSSGSTDIDRVLSDIRPRISSVKNEPASANLEVESSLNADGVARDLVRRSEILRTAVETGHLLIKPSLYRIDSGKVTFY